MTQARPLETAHRSCLPISWHVVQYRVSFGGMSQRDCNLRIAWSKLKRKPHIVQLAGPVLPETVHCLSVSHRQRPLHTTAIGGVAPNANAKQAHFGFNERCAREIGGLARRPKRSSRQFLKEAFCRAPESIVKYSRVSIIKAVAAQPLAMHTLPSTVRKKASRPSSTT